MLKLVLEQVNYRRSISNSGMAYPLYLSLGLGETPLGH